VYRRPLRKPASSSLSDLAAPLSFSLPSTVIYPLFPLRPRGYFPLGSFIKFEQTDRRTSSQWFFLLRFFSDPLTNSQRSSKVDTVLVVSTLSPPPPLDVPRMESPSFPSWRSSSSVWFSGNLVYHLDNTRAWCLSFSGHNFVHMAHLPSSVPPPSTSFRIVTSVFSQQLEVPFSFFSVVPTWRILP